MRLSVLSIPQEDTVHVRAGILEQPVVVVGEDDEGYLTVTKDAQLVSLLHEAKLPLCEGHLKYEWGFCKVNVKVRVTERVIIIFIIYGFYYDSIAMPCNHGDR